MLDVWANDDPARLKVLAVACPYPFCRSPEGQVCVGPDGMPLRSQPYHVERFDARFLRKATA